MKIQVVILTALLAIPLQLIFPWWMVMVAAFIISILNNQSARYAFLNGFAGIFTLWLIWSASISYLNEGVLSARLAELLMLPHSTLAILVTALIGGICGGFAALTANRLRKAVVPE